MQNCQVGDSWGKDGRKPRRKAQGNCLQLISQVASAAAWPVPFKRGPHLSPAHTDRQAARYRELRTRQNQSQDRTMNRILVFTGRSYSEDLKIYHFRNYKFQKRNYQSYDRLRKDEGRSSSHQSEPHSLTPHLGLMENPEITSQRNKVYIQTS